VSLSSEKQVVLIISCAHFRRESVEEMRQDYKDSATVSAEEEV